MKKRLESEAGCRRCYFEKQLFRLAGLQDLAGFGRICSEYSLPQTSLEWGLLMANRPEWWIHIEANIKRHVGKP